MTPPARDVGRWAVAAVLYYAAAWVGLRVAVFPETASPIWPATGVAIAALTLLGLRAWPAIAVAVFAVELPAFGPVGASLLAAGNTLEAVIGAWVLRRVGGAAAFSRSPGVGWFMAGAAVGSLTSAAFAVVPLLSLEGNTPIGQLVFTWFMGNLLGGILVAPALVLLAARTGWERRTGAEWAGYVALSVAIAVAAFYPWRLEEWASIRLGFLVVGPLLWAAARFGPFVTTWSALAMSVAAMVGLGAGATPVPGARNAAILQVQVLAGVMTVLALFIAASVQERRQTIRLLEQNQGRLEAADRLKVDFLNKAAHELRTPLTPMLLQVDLLRRKPTEADRDRGLAVLQRSVERMTGIITKLLSAADVGEQVRRIRPLPTPMADLIEDVRREFEAPAAARGVRIETAADDGDAVVDRQTVERVLRELVDNAVRFAQVDGRVRVEARRMPGGGSRFSVTDDGEGLPGGDRARIFEPFASGDADLPDRHGLGLYITRALVLGHGGRLLAEDAPGGGARFVVELPG